MRKIFFAAALLVGIMSSCNDKKASTEGASQTPMETVAPDDNMQTDTSATSKPPIDESTPGVTKNHGEEQVP